MHVGNVDMIAISAAVAAAATGQTYLGRDVGRDPLGPVGRAIEGWQKAGLGQDGHAVMPHAGAEVGLEEEELLEGAVRLLEAQHVRVIGLK